MSISNGNWRGFAFALIADGRSAAPYGRDNGGIHYMRNREKGA